MTAQEAYKKVKTKFPDVIVLKAFNYTSIYAFVTCPKGKLPEETVFRSQTAVDKKTGKIFFFQPYMISKQEYDSGKEIPINRLVFDKET